MFLLHFLVMTPTLLSFSRFYEFFHGFEDLIGSSEIFIDEMGAV
jgi:hypothetical protein